MKATSRSNDAAGARHLAVRCQSLISFLVTVLVCAAAGLFLYDGCALVFGFR